MYMHMFSLCLPLHHRQQWNPQRWARRRRRRAHLCAPRRPKAASIGWWWWGGKHSENICIYISNVSVLPYLSPFLLFALRRFRRNWLFANHIYDVIEHLRTGRPKLCMCVYVCSCIHMCVDIYIYIYIYIYSLASTSMPPCHCATSVLLAPVPGRYRKNVQKKRHRNII